MQIEPLKLFLLPSAQQSKKIELEINKLLFAHLYGAKSTKWLDDIIN